MLVNDGKVLAIDSVNHDRTMSGDGVFVPLGIRAADTYVTVQPLMEDGSIVDKNFVLHWNGMSPEGSASWRWQEEQGGGCGDNVSARNGLQAAVEFDAKYIEMTPASKAAVDLVAAKSAVWDRQQVIVTKETDPSAIPPETIGIHLEEK